MTPKDVESRSDVASRRSLLRALALSPLLLVPAMRAHAKDDVLTAFRKRFANLSTISFRFSSAAAKGTIQARKGGSHRIVLPDRTLVSNGKTLWNAVAASKTVVIEPVKKRAGEFSLDQIFFVVFSAYTATVTKSTSSGGTIRLTPPDASMKIGNVDVLDLVVSSNGLVSSIVVHEGSTITTWKITDLKLNPTLKDSTFTFTVPGGWQTVDLR
ncbi:MAG: outer membrane lipoprotein carrier protein LolA [Ignavibacteriae bacterium]|nr:MAG: outer membrane lipoprotein carrier protein LolA [Ignavibacteriota bacterium]